MKFPTILFALFTLVLAGCGNINPPSRNPDIPAAENKPDSTGFVSKLPLDRIKLPQGFKITTYAEDVKNARSMALSSNGTLFVGTRDEGSVYALKDTDGDMRADKKYVLATGLKMPNGVALRDGALYVAEVSRILRFDNIEANLDNPPKPVVVYDKYPTETHHGWKYIAFGPDGKLYVPVGAPCNICKSEKDVYASITRINPDGTNMEVVQHGIRNTVGFTWHPHTKELWFTDNGRDMMGDEVPGCELNRATQEDQHFGYPYIHQGNVPDPEFGKGKKASDYTAPVKVLGPHVAALGLEFYTGNQFPAEYKNQILIAEHGSWNRSKKIGYRVMMVTLDENQKATSYKPFAEGWLDESKDDAWGRPVDLELMPDGSILVSDDYADAIYRIYYAG